MAPPGFHASAHALLGFNRLAIAICCASCWPSRAGKFEQTSTLNPLNGWIARDACSGIAHFLQAKNIGGELREIAMDRTNLPIFFGARSIGTPAGEPLDVPKSGGDRDGRTNRGWRYRGWGSGLGAESANEESGGKQSREKSGEHGGRVTEGCRRWRDSLGGIERSALDVWNAGEARNNWHRATEHAVNLIASGCHPWRMILLSCSRAACSAFSSSS